MDTNILLCFAPMVIGIVLFFIVGPIIDRIRMDRIILKAYRDGELEWTDSYDEDF